MSADILEQAFAASGAVLGTVTKDDLDKPTPCASWTVRQLINHLVGGTTFFAVTAETGVAPTDRTDTDHTTGDFTTEFAHGAQRAVAAFRARGAMDRLMHLPFGQLPGSVFVWIASIDTFTHGWDLAQATGQSSDLDPNVATPLLERARMFLPDAMRGPDGQAPFGPIVDPPTGATPADQLAAFMGRHP